MQFSNQSGVLLLIKLPLGRGESSHPSLLRIPLGFHTSVSLMHVSENDFPCLKLIMTVGLSDDDIKQYPTQGIDHCSR